MYLDFEIIRRSLDELSSFHAFFGITFLVCKLDHLPVGKPRTFEINNEEKYFLDFYYRPDPRSKLFPAVQDFCPRGPVAESKISIVWFTEHPHARRFRSSFFPR
jgi:hypothetical protein